MSISGIESNGIGGGGFGGGISPWGIGNFGGGGSGIGAFGLFGLLGIDSLGRRRGGDDDCCDSNRDLAVLAAIGNAKDATVAEGRALGAAICDSEKTNLNAFYAAAIQAANNTQAVKDQATAFAIVNDKRFDDLSAAGVAQTAAIIGTIEANEKANLRDLLFLERTKNGALESKEVINQMGIAFGNQIQAANSNVVAVQTQVGQLTNVIATLAAQVAKSSQDVINIGGLMAGVAQTANPVNVK